MYGVLSYPLQTIYTNRIVGTPIFNTTGERLPREFLAIYERGELSRGLYRGFMPFFYFGLCYSQVNCNSAERAPLVSLVLGTTILNWLEVLKTRRMIMTPEKIENPVPYPKMFVPSALLKTVSLGLAPHLARNSLCCLALYPKQMGSTDEMLQAAFALGAVVLSHPFEVARVLIVHNEGGRLAPTLSALY